jgi:hypothetical protein
MSLNSTIYEVSSNSPNKRVESLLPVRTIKRSEQVTHKVESHLLMGSLGWKSTHVTVPLCPGSLYWILVFSTSQTVTVRSAPPTATRPPLSVRDHAPRSKAFSNPAGAPMTGVSFFD